MQPKSWVEPGNKIKLDTLHPPLLLTPSLPPPPSSPSPSLPPLLPPPSSSLPLPPPPHSLLSLLPLLFTSSPSSPSSPSDPQSSRGGSLEDAAYRCYRKRSGEEGLLERKQKQRRIEASIELFSRRESRETHKAHYQHLLNLHQQYSTMLQPLCVNNGCGNKCLPFASRCPRRIL